MQEIPEAKTVDEERKQGTNSAIYFTFRGTHASPKLIVKI